MKRKKKGKNEMARAGNLKVLRDNCLAGANAVIKK